jgi:hypothetical protein
MRNTPIFFTLMLSLLVLTQPSSALAETAPAPAPAPGNDEPAAEQPAGNEAEELTGAQIMRRNDEASRAASEHQIMRMVLTDKRGKQRERTIEGWSYEVSKEEEKRFARFLEPGDIKDTTLLTYDYEQNDDDIWLYLPALKKVKRILSSDKTDNFMGSDFTYWDMENIDLLNWEYTLKGSEDLDGLAVWLVEGTPTSEDELEESGYSKATYWVCKDDYTARRVEFIDHKDRFAKRLTASDIRVIGDTNPKPRAHSLQMENLLTKHSTLLEFREFQLDVEVDETIFSQRNLRQ